MNISVYILFIISLLFQQKQKQFPTNFVIGKHTYIMTIEKRHNHDDNIDATFFVVRNKKNKQNQISSNKIAEQKDSIIIRGSYIITTKFIEFKEVYFNNSNDSMMKRYYPNRYGNLILTEYTYYKQGVVTKTKL
jgi:hypothetical protein